MATLLERLTARIALVHARRTYQRFLHTLHTGSIAQEKVLAEVVAQVRDSDFGRRHQLARVRNLADLRGAVPLQTYEDIRPWVDRVAEGELGALFSPGHKVVMLATSSGTTSRPKRIPVTPAFVNDYRRGWNTFGLKLLTDHPDAVLRPILQSSGRFDESRTSAGIPVGAITGLLARTQKRIVRRFYVGTPDIAAIPDARIRYYTLMRCAVVRDVAFCVTANPATLIRLAATADECSETLIRDVHDGTLSSASLGGEPLPAIAARLRADPPRARQLAALRTRCGALRPRDYWRLSFLACWTGGSMGHYLARLADWYGPLPVRDVGLLASEGRVSIPLEDGTPVGVLDLASAAFEFIPAEDWDRPDAQTLLPADLEQGQDYAVVLTNRAGLLRYRLDDVVRVKGKLGIAPLVEFMHRAGRVSSVAGEKLTENQLVAAVRAACEQTGAAPCDFVAAPVWAEPPYYRVSTPLPATRELAAALDAALCRENEEYASRRKSLRLGPIQLILTSERTFAEMDRRALASRGSTAEQYKRVCLFSHPGDDERALNDRIESGRPLPSLPT